MKRANTCWTVYRLVAAALLLSFVHGTAVAAEPVWMTLPKTPTLPAAAQSGTVHAGGARIWYASFGSGPPVLLLHGGLANSDYWGDEVRSLSQKHTVIVMDSRGHGRSSNDDTPYGYETMADDVVALLDHLRIRQTALVGWSDGAIIGLVIAIRHPERLTRLFAFAANMTPDGVNDISSSPVFNAYLERAKSEYARTSPTPGGYDAFFKGVTRMWETQPSLTDDQLRRITIPVWIVDGDHDEAIKRGQTEQMAAAIPGAGLLILPNVSHFAFLQDPGQFDFEVERFLDQ